MVQLLLLFWIQDLFLLLRQIQHGVILGQVGLQVILTLTQMVINCSLCKEEFGIILGEQMMQPIRVEHFYLRLIQIVLGQQELIPHLILLQEQEMLKTLGCLQKLSVLVCCQVQLLIL